jgi:hypothetical protein
MEIIRRLARFPWLSTISIAGLCLPFAVCLLSDPGEGAAWATLIAWGVGGFIGLLFALGAWSEKNRWWKIAATASGVYTAITVILWALIHFSP